MHKFLFITIFFLNFHALTAQEKKKVYVDSIELQTTEVEEPGSIIQAIEERMDTSLFPSPVNLSYDSITAIKNNDSYAYSRYLDSLLKNRKKEKQQQQSQTKPGKPQGSSSKESSSRSEVEVATEPNTFFASTGSQVVLWTLAGLFILFVLYKLFLSEVIFRKRSNSTPAMASEDKEIEITSESDLDKLISGAVRNGYYRQAIRYWYLKSLHHLNEKGILQLAVDKTNYQYVNEIKNPAQRNEFAALTLNYEYVWYGEFQIDSMLYQRLENDFSSFIKKV